MEAVRAINRSKIDQNTLVARQMQQEIDHMRAKHEAEVTALRQKCDKLLGDVQEYNNSVCIRTTIFCGTKARFMPTAALSVRYLPAYPDSSPLFFL